MKTIRREQRWSGVCSLARELGVSRHHLTAVLHGRRRAGEELSAALAARGIKYRRLRRPEERW